MKSDKISYIDSNGELKEKEIDLKSINPLPCSTIPAETIEAEIKNQIPETLMEAGNNYSIENTEKVAGFVMDLIKQAETAMEDGKFTAADLPGFIDEIIEIPGVITAVGNIKNEVTDTITAEEESSFISTVVNHEVIPDAYKPFATNVLNAMFSVKKAIESFPKGTTNA